MMNGFSIKSWPHFYEQAFISMRPGGWVENQEYDVNFSTDDNTAPADSAVLRLQTLWNQGLESVGMTGRCYPDKMKQQMIDAGFINVTVRPYKVPSGPWPKDKRLREAGMFQHIGLYEGLTGMTLRVFTQFLGWSVEEVELFLTEVRAELRKKYIHWYLPVYASQPLLGPVQD